MKHVLQGMQPEWDLERNTDLYKKAERCEMYSNGRQPKPLSGFSWSKDDAHQQSPEDWECTGNYRGKESSPCMRNAAKPPLTKPANAHCIFFFFPDNPVP